MRRYDQKHIRNFCIIAHIDHGKTTLSDRILEKTGAVAQRDLKEQMLDDLSLERERGITIKLNAVSVNYHAKNGEDYLFNLIDTPGHVDFTYEVSRSLAACEGAILVVDATQGVQAQTLANSYLAIDNDLTILTCINKVDLQTARVEETKEELMEDLGIDPDETVPISAKTGYNVDLLMEKIVEKLPCPQGDDNKPLKALVFDARFDAYRGVVILIRVKEGSVKVGDTIKMMQTGLTYRVEEIGIRTPDELKTGELHAGEVGYLTAQIHDIKDIVVGETVTLADNPADKPLPGYKKMLPMVYAGIYPTDNKDFENLRVALEKFSLNDSSLVYEPETSAALGSGFRCGFLGLLHMDVVQERLETEYNLDLISTSPSVKYRITLKNGNVIMLENPSEYPDPSEIAEEEEPYCKVEIMTPSEYMGPVMNLCQARRGTFVSSDFIDTKRLQIVYEMPLSEIIFSFFNKLKSITAGYASLDYELIGYRESDLCRLDVLLNGQVIDALTMIIWRGNAVARGRAICAKLKEVIPRQQFEIPVQAAIGGKIIAREDIKAVRKDVLAKCYGGDISRKKKLLEAQKRGKKRMKQFGKVSVPQEAFIAVLTVDGRENGNN